MAGRVLYFECESGISGDMAVAAMLDLGANESVLRRALESLDVPGFSVSVTDVMKSGIRAKDFAVELEEDNHDHDVGYLYGHGHGHDHHHDHDHAHHDGHHAHRHYGDIVSIIEKADITPNARGIALRILAILGEAESEAHDVPLSEVHFHEVGAVDSIVDIVSLGVCLDDLGIERVCFSDLYEGTGTVRCQHGVMPVPVPAVTNIARRHGLTLRITDSAGEYVTPTGAAFAAAVGNCARPSAFSISAVGIGAGKRESERSGLLRAMVLEPSGSSDTVVKLECNVDDCTGEVLGYTSERLFEAGARDVSFTPLLMKKGRPGWLMTVICTEDTRGRLESIIFSETTTIGIRRCEMERSVLRRDVVNVRTEYGDVPVKVSAGGGSERVHPEFEDVARIARGKGVPFREVYDSAVRAYRGRSLPVLQVHQDERAHRGHEGGLAVVDPRESHGLVDQPAAVAGPRETDAVEVHRELDVVRPLMGHADHGRDPVGEEVRLLVVRFLEIGQPLHGDVVLHDRGEYPAVAEVVHVRVQDAGPHVREGLRRISAPLRDRGHHGPVVGGHPVLGELEEDLLLGAHVAVQVGAGPGQAVGDGGQRYLVVRALLEERLRGLLDLGHPDLLLLRAPGPYEIVRHDGRCEDVGLI